MRPTNLINVLTLATNVQWGIAHAYETDQITERYQPLADITAEASAEADLFLDRAVATTNERLSCSADVERTRRVLARQIYRETSVREFVEGRARLRGMGHGRYGKWLETADIARREFEDRRDIYAEVWNTESVVLAQVGPCSTVRIGGQLMGTDKPDHFFATGYHYFRKAADREREERAIKAGVQAENGQFGIMSSATFSFADLDANWKGYAFYAQLLTDDSVLQLDEAGCVARVRPFDWSEWVDWRWDELLNPPYYVELVGRRVDLTLDKRADEICANASLWAEELANRPTPWVGEQPEWYGRAPRRSDPFHLLDRCDPG